MVVDGQYKLQPGAHVELTTPQPRSNSSAIHAGEIAAAANHAQAGEVVNISEPFIRRPVATSLLMAGVILLGLLGYKLLPISALPTVDFPTIEVTTFYPGASADVMVSSITTPLERQFGQISGLASMNSTSSFGTSTITLQFVLDRPIDVAAQDVQAAINVAGGFLPQGSAEPAEIQQGQSGGHADPDAVDHVRQFAARSRERFCRHACSRKN